MSVKPSINIQLDTPCHEDWEKMDEVGKGRLCTTCNKEVIDFTGYSDKELQNFFLLNPVFVCGRFRMEQTNVTLDFNKSRGKKNGFMPVIAASVFTISVISANASPVSLQDSPLVSHVLAHQYAFSPQTDSVVISGLVTDEKGAPLHNASVIFNEKKYLTDDNGDFRITLSSPELVKGIFIFSYDSLLNEVRNYNPVMGATNYVIQLREKPESQFITMGVPVIEFNLPTLTVARFFEKNKLSQEALTFLASLANSMRNQPAGVVDINTNYHQSKKVALDKAKIIKEHLVEKQGIAEERLIITEPVKVSTKKMEQTISFTANHD